MRVLITGLSGFVGRFLAEWCLDQNCEVFGYNQRLTPKDAAIFSKLGVKSFEGDLLEYERIFQCLKAVKPDRIFHLAAQSFVSLSWNNPQETLSVNVIGQAHLLEAVRKSGLNPRIQIAGSSEQYGLVEKGDIPIKESQPFKPLSPYAVSKVTQDLMAYQYHKSYGTDIVRTRAFNHTGPRRHEAFVTSSLAKQVASIEAGFLKPVIEVGDVSVVRDFTDVRDVVRAYWLALEKGTSGEAYNICSGKGWSIRDVLDVLLKKTSVKVKIHPDPKRFRPSDIPLIVGDCNKFNSVTGWKPEISFEQSMEDLLDYWRMTLEVKKNVTR